MPSKALLRPAQVVA
jgi:pyruvate/2-oxoglutarate dehydrogenase complex dihydrolipoamide dehydrogenase (E3) component